MKNFVWLDDKSKTVTWLNRNYFFAITVFIVLLNIIIYAVHGSNTGNFAETPPHWGEFSVANLF